ncbi:SusC/RagA family TonB-linked outer membrane protein [Pedobacter petrophilus]|uniref:SusC/RagA family TonB-linked outer membrane protein n=1 Tax=Pedobacter petrophilus TaxID=1908241 RepID=A0A7K0FUT8_9SPHI|nr:SusC/RagA family TonB-linked outer membrane protein [Pedobacter petrophilus]MRX74709.1 SusC/RagA family TonB-linked outer membrane protein [Pedobacter petrophilus]
METLKNGKPQYIVVWFLAILMVLFSIASAFAQDETGVKVLTGSVSLSEGINQSVTIRSSKNGSLRSKDSGEFTFKLRVLPDTLTFSLLGFTSTKRIVEKNYNFNESLTIRMVPDAKDLGSVEINTGYQKLKPNEINGTVSIISEKALNATQGTNILDRLAGQTSGLLVNIGKTSPNASLNISVRGLGTINGPLDPLIVLDGFIYEGDVNNINPNDIENVSILKDASAASIWGARAGNGVIVITSKKGKLNQKMQLSFSSSLQVQALANLMEIPLMTASDYIDVEKLIFDAGFFDDQISRFPYLSLTPAVENFLSLKQGKINQSQSDAFLDKLRTQDVRKSYQDNFYTNPVTQQYSLNLKGGGENYSYLMGASYDNSLSENYIKSDKINLHLSNQFKPVKNLTISTNIYLTTATFKSGRPAYGTLNIGQRNPTYSIFSDESGIPLTIARAYRNAYTDTAGSGRLLDWKYYPTEEYKHNIQKINRSEVYGSVGANYKIFEFLNAELNYQLQRQNSKEQFESDKYSFFSRDIVNSFSQLNRATNQIIYPVPLGGVMNYGDSRTQSSTGRFQLNLDKSFGAHVIRAIAGLEARDVQNLGSSSVFHGYNGDPLSYSNVDVVNFYPDFLTGSNKQIGSNGALTHTTYRFMSFYGNASYSYLGRYLASGSVRRDGSNIFGANTNDKWKPLWSLGLGWVASNEKFYALQWLPVLRFNATFGYTGNVDLTKTSLPIAGYATNNQSGLPFTRISSINNPDLKWEQLSQLDLKMSFETRGRWLFGAISYFLKKGTDLYGSAPYDYTAWGARNELTRNVADMKGYGVDAEFHSKNITTKDFEWSSDLFFNFNKNKTVKYYRPTGTGLYSFIGAGKEIIPIVGLPLYGITSFKFGGLDNAGNPLGYLNGQLSKDYSAILREGSTTGNNLIFNGVSSPAVYGSLINNFTYGRISLSFNISYRLGYYFQKQTINYYSLINSGISHSDYALRWQKPGDESQTNIPSFLYPVDANRDVFFGNSDVNVLRADNIRLQYVNLSYRFESGKWKFPLRNLEFTAGIQNAGLLWTANTEHLDPDYLNSFNNTKNYVLSLKGSF